MVVIRGERGTGKTTELIKLSYKYDAPILCKNKKSVLDTFAKARDMGLIIPFPVFIGEEIKADKLIIDEVDYILEIMLNTKIIAVSTSSTIANLN